MSLLRGRANYLGITLGIMVVTGAVLAARQTLAQQHPVVRKATITSQGPDKRAEEAPSTSVEQPDREGLDDLVRLLAEAETLFYSADQMDSVPILTGIIDRLLPQAARGEGSEAESRILAQTLALRAEANFNMGDEQGARTDLIRVLETDAGYSLDPQKVSPKLLAVLDDLRRQMVGWLQLTISPADAIVLIDGRQVVAPELTLPVLTASYLVRIERTGYHPKEVEIFVAAEARELLQVTLQRASAVLEVATRPAGVEVLIEGQLAGMTEPDATGGGQSGKLIVDGLASGRYEILLRKTAYRSQRAVIEVSELSDFRLREIELEPARGTIRLSGMVADASVAVDGETLSHPPEQQELELPPGEYRIKITGSSGGRFEQTVQVTDRTMIEVAVELRPSLALIAVAAPSPGLVLRLRRELLGAFTGLRTWTFLDRVDAGEQILPTFGLVPKSSSSPAKSRIKWIKLQEALDSEIAASLYVIAILRQESPGLEPDFWFWSPAPEPATPSLWSLRPGARQTTAPLIEALDRPLQVKTVWLGARLIDSAAAAGPVVAGITAGSPASSAGLETGDIITAIDGQPIASRRQLAERLEDGGVELSIQRDDTSRSVRLMPGVSPFVARPGASLGEGPLRRAVLRAKLASGSSDAPEWLLGLNQAAFSLDAGNWDEAARLLSTLEAATDSGLGQGTIDYWLGVALSKIQPGSEAARHALERAATTTDARLYSNDGPLIAPRARARLQALARPEP